MYRKRQREPIPFVVSFHIAFLPEGLADHDYEQRVRTIIREHLPSVQQDQTDRNEAGLWEEYDERVSELIEEELARN